MECTRLRLAGRVVQVTTCNPGFGAFAQRYLTEDEPDFCIKTNAEDIRFEREKSAAEDKVEGRPVRVFSDSYLETLAVYRKIAARMLEWDTLLMHGSAISVDGQAYLFIAASGTGKSTHTRLWRERFGARAAMINDDKPLVRVEQDRLMVCGTPWDGKHRLSTPAEAPLKAICVLERGEQNRIDHISARSAFPMLLQQTYRPQNEQDMLKTVMLLERVSQKATLYRLRCNMQQEAVSVSYTGMNQH